MLEYLKWDVREYFDWFAILFVGLRGVEHTGSSVITACKYTGGVQNGPEWSQETQY